MIFTRYQINSGDNWDPSKEESVVYLGEKEGFIVIITARPVADPVSAPEVVTP